jgi:thiopeptide-type bacteriocin biosynthesis protein
MTDIQNYKFLSKVFLRAPYYSFARYDLDRLPEVLADQAFRNAIFLASPEFYSQLENRNFEPAEMTDKERHTLSKYYNRMCFRPTPFGTFASFTVLEWTNDNQAYLTGDDHNMLHLQPGNEFLYQDRKSRIAPDENRLLVVNPTLYRFGKDFRLIRSLADKKGKYQFDVASIEAEQFYRQIIALFKNRKWSCLELSSWIVSYLHCSKKDAKEYIDFLLRSQVLLGPETMKVLYTAADLDQSRCGEKTPWWARLWLSSISRSGSLASWSALLKNQIPEGSDLPDQCFYSALERPLKSGGVPLTDRQDLVQAITFLHRLATPVEQPALKNFIAEFKSRFDLRKVPLLEALDPDSGINYGSLLGGIPERHVMDGIRFPAKPAGQTSLNWTGVHRALLQSWRTGGRTYYDPVELQTELLTELAEPDPNAKLPNTLAVMYRKTEEYLVVESAGGATATALIGRFSLFDEKSWQLAQKLALAEQESHPDLIFADIVQLSDLHTDNINRRKDIFHYNIPINTYTDVNNDRQLRLDELYLSVVGDELYLESKRFHKRVIPRLSTAYNYNHNKLGIFRLLCDLQYQGLCPALSFDLEQLFPGMDFYPRVTTGNVILSTAKWNFNSTELQELAQTAQRSPVVSVRAFRKKYQLPQQVSVGQSDQQLVFDLTSRIDIDFFIRHITGLKKLVIQEYLPADSSVKIANKPVAAQMVAFLTHDKRIYQPLVYLKGKKTTKITRYFIPGDRWLYVKLFCTPESANPILSRIVQPFLRKNKKLIDGWFFIRYREGGYHLRLRILVNGEHQGALLTGLKKELNKEANRSMVREITVEAYQREIERYGADLIEQIEQYFWLSSIVVMETIRENQNRHSPNEFETAFRAVYHLLVVFWSDQADRIDFVARIVNSFTKEFEGSRQLKIDMDSRYRDMKPALTAVIETTGELSQINQKTENCLFGMLDIAKVIAGRVAGKSITDQLQLFADLIHMHLNRAFFDHQREQEFLIYHCLQKYLISVKARSRTSLNVTLH